MELSKHFILIMANLIFFHSLALSDNNGSLVPALYIFGDSIVDTGNTFPDSAQPFGVDLPSSIDRRRWTNGRNIADYFAFSLGLPFIPPYNNSEAAAKSTTGINYAFAGSGILPETKKGAVLSFDQQLDNFETTRTNHLAKVFGAELFNHLARSLFLVSFGINDYWSYIIIGKTPHIEPQSFANYLLTSLSQRLVKLYEMGARKFIVTNIWPLGCTPLFTNSDVCNEKINDMLLPYNSSLPLMLQSLASTFPGFQFSCSDDFAFVQNLLLNTAITGITNITGKCYDENTNILCQDRDTYLHFDGVHPTEAANHRFSSMCFSDNLCSPMNIKELVSS